MAREKKDKKLRDINGKKIDLQGSRSSIIIAGISLLISIVIFVILLNVKDIFVKDIVYTDVIKAKTAIPEGTVVTTENAESYFYVAKVNVLDAVDGSLSSVDSILNQQSKVSLAENEIVTAKDFKESIVHKENFEDPVEMSIALGSIAESNGGNLRSGDVVNLSMMFSRSQLGMSSSLMSANKNSLMYVPDTYDFDLSNNSEPVENVEGTEEEAVESHEMPEMEMTAPITLTEEDLTGDSSDYIFDNYAEYILENIVVEKALDSAGNQISTTDQVTPASILVFVVEREQELAINNALANCAGIRVSKVID